MKVELSFNCSGVWVDYSKDISVTSLKITKKLSEQKAPQRTFSSSIEVTGNAYVDIHAHLVTSGNLYSNQVCVKIIDDECNGKELFFRVETQDVKWCDDDLCKTNLELIEDNEILDCIDNTDIWDNHQGWFSKNRPSPLHPKFRYCDVTRPTGVLAALIGVTVTLDLIINSINFLIVVINGVINAINTIPGINLGNVGQIPNLSQLVVGCERVHPSPFIRTYKDNVCDKCNITVNASTNPIFYSPSSQYYNLTMMSAVTRKGFKYGASSTENYIEDNRPNWRIAKLNNALAEVFNARWYMKGDEMHFNRKDLIGAQMWGTTPYIDVSKNGAHYKELQGSVCYGWNGQQKVSKLETLYTVDSIDREGDSMRRRFGGFSEDMSSVNYRHYDKREFTNFGAQAYSWDGRDTIYDKHIVDYNVLNGNTDYKGILKIQADFFRLNKLIIWDGVSSFQSAEAIGKPYNTFDISEWSDDDGILSGTNASWFEGKNYPMFTSPIQNAIYPNLFEFHKIDLPKPDKKDNIYFDFTTNFCCWMYSLELYQRANLDNGNIGEIQELTFNLITRQMKVTGNLIN